MRYVQATIQQTKAYRKPRYDIPFYLEELPHRVQSLCLLNIEKGRSIPKSFLPEVSKGEFKVTTQTGENKWTVNICEGVCTCPAFQSTHIPCKHFFALFHHYPSWSWQDLPPSLTKSSHMTLDSNVTELSILDCTKSQDSEDYATPSLQPTQPLPPPKSTPG